MVLRATSKQALPQRSLCRGPPSVASVVVVHWTSEEWHSGEFAVEVGAFSIIV